MWSDNLSTAEAELSERVLEVLSEKQWARQLLRRIEQAGGVSRETKPLLFEARLAHELDRAGTAPNYEYAAGVGDSTVDFQLPGARDWLVECVSVQASDAAKRAMRKVGMIYVQHFSSIGQDQRESPQGEMILVQQKIAEKVEIAGQPTKFPAPTGTWNMIVVDVRGYLDGGGDVFDYRQMAYGWQGIPRGDEWLIHWWEKGDGTREPVKGLFEAGNPLAAAPRVRDRIHFLGFVREKDYVPGEIGSRMYALANPDLFLSEEQARSAYETFPLQPSTAT